MYQGEFVVLLGPSGSGKSTLLNNLSGLNAPTSGEVSFRDHNLTQANAVVEHARREFERAEKLVESGDIPKQEFERLHNAEKTCLQQLEAVNFKARAAASEVEVALHCGSDASCNHLFSRVFN